MVDAISVVVETQSGICAAHQKERTDRPLQVRILSWLFFNYFKTNDMKNIHILPIEKASIEVCKIILTTDPDLIKDGVQAIDDEFLHWFVKNPSCEWINVKYQYWEGKYTYGIIIPKEEPKQELFANGERVYLKEDNNVSQVVDDNTKDWSLWERLPKQETNLKKHLDSCEEYQGPRRSAIVDKQERSYSEEEVLELLRKAHFVEQNIEEWFEQFKKK